MTSPSDSLTRNRTSRLPSVAVLAILGTGVCALIWGTTWYAKIGRAHV